MDLEQWKSSLDEPIFPNVEDEFGTLKTAIVSGVGSPQAYAVQSGASYEAARVFIAAMLHRSILQHGIFLEELENRGVRLIHPRHPNVSLDASDSVEAWTGADAFARDYFGVIGRHTIFSKVADHRNELRLFYEPIFRQIKGGKTMLDEQFSWGNAVQFDDTVFVGEEHPNIWQCFKDQGMPDEELRLRLRIFDEKQDGFRSVNRVLSEISTTRSLVRVPLRSTIDLDVGFAPLPRRRKNHPRVALVQADRLHANAENVLSQHFDYFEYCEDHYDVLGCNILWLDPETPVIGKDATKTIQILRELGFNPLTFDRSGFQEIAKIKGGESGGWRCLTGALERENDYNG